jgi:hypothetical protein
MRSSQRTKKRVLMTDGGKTREAQVFHEANLGAGTSHNSGQQDIPVANCHIRMLFTVVGKFGCAA